MDIFNFDYSMLFSWEVFIFLIFGTLFGLFAGALPGLGATISIALLLPLTYSMSPVAAILMLVAVYQAAEYGGSVSSILLGVPGTPAAVATSIDGNAMSKQGKPGKALAYSITASAIGGIIGAIILISLAAPLSKLTIQFGAPEFFLLGILGLVSVISLSSKDIPKSIISVMFGLLLGMVGMDVMTGATKFTAGNLYLMEGFPLIPLLVGMFAISEVLMMLSDDLQKRYVTDSKNLKTNLTWKEFKTVRRNIFKGSLIGSFAGIIPGLGAGPASWIAYTEAKRTSKNPENFGKGDPNGIAAPEAANNSVVGGALVPLLTLGIPGSPATAVILGAFLIHGIQPGPRVFNEDANLIYSIFFGVLITAVIMYILGKYTTSLAARLLTIPNYALIPIILMVALIGAYVDRASLFDVWIAIIAGIVAFFIRKLDYSLPAFILAFVLTPLIEESFRRALLLSNGSYSIFISKGYSITIIILILFLVGSRVYSTWKTSKNVNKELEIN